MSSISIKTGLGRAKRNIKRTRNPEQEAQSTQIFPVFGIMVMISILAFFGLLLFSQPSANIANTGTAIAPQTLSLSGTLTSRIALEEANVQCSSTGMMINGIAPIAYSLKYAMGNAAVSNNLSVDGTNTLTLSINSSTKGIAPNVFTAYDGVVYAQNGHNYVNAFLTNDAGQPLYINATVACN